jgi:putative membrane protein
MTKFSLALAILLLVAPAASAQTTGKPDEPEAGEKAAEKTSEMSAEEFLAKTAAANRFEIDASKLAYHQAKKKEVQELAEALVSDHTAAAEKLEAAVQADGRLALPKDDKPDAKYPQALDQLKASFGDAFDRAYLEAMFTGHKEGLERYKGYAASGNNPNLKKFAQEIAPIVERHLIRVRGMLGP